MDFGDAIKALKTGSKVARAAWPALSVFVYYVPLGSYPARTGVAKDFFGDALVPYKAYLAIKQADGKVCVYMPSTDSLLAEDWEVVP